MMANLSTEDYSSDVGLNSSLVPGTGMDFENISLELTTPCSNDYCVTDEEYVDMVQSYIFPSVFEWFLILLYAVSFIVGLVGNFLVCFAVWRNKSMRTVTNYFIVNLAAGDFLVILICMPPTVLGDVTETWYMGSVLCKIVKYFQGVSVCVSVLTLCCISIERWYAICHPLAFKSTPQRAKVMVAGIWITAFSIVIPELAVLNIHRRFSPELTILLTSCKPEWSYTSQAIYQLFLSVAMYVLPFLLMFVLYLNIAKCLWSNSIPTETSRDQLKPTETKYGHENQLQARRKVARMLMAVVCMFGLCYLPVHLLNILRYSGALESGGNKAVYFALVAHWLCYFNSAINPVIYNFMSTKFRREFRSACSCCGIFKCGDPDSKKKNQNCKRAGNVTAYTYHYTSGLNDHHATMATAKTYVTQRH